MIYFVQSGDNGPVKIGYSKDIQQRLSTLQTSTAEPLRLLGVMDGDERREAKIHRMFEEHRIQGEWFKSSEALHNFITISAQKAVNYTAYLEQKDGLIKVTQLPFQERNDLVLPPANGASTNGISSVSMIVTPEQADFWFNNCNYKNNRPIYKTQLTEIVKAMNGDKWEPGTSIHFAVLDGLHLVDGQHRLKGVVSTHKQQVFVVVYHQVDSYDELAYLYSQFDRHRRRNPDDTYRAYELPEITGLQSKMIRKVDAAIRMIKSDFTLAYKKTGYDDQEMMAAIIEYAPEAKIFQQLIKGCNAKLRDAMLRRSTLSIALVTLKEAVNYIPRQDVHDFWIRTSDGDELKRDDPRMKLRDKLMTTRISGGTGGRYEQLSIIDACRYVAVAWNAYTDNKRPRILNIRADNIPIKNTSYQLPKIQDR